MSEDYLGATESELGDASMSRRLWAYSDQRTLFPHSGWIKLEPRLLVLGNWRNIPREQITGVELTFTEFYGRGHAAGLRGNWASFGMFGSLGKPLILDLANGESIYLLIDFRFFSGINDNRRWVRIMRDWIQQGVPTR